MKFEKAQIGGTKLVLEQNFQNLQRQSYGFGFGHLTSHLVDPQNFKLVTLI